MAGSFAHMQQHVISRYRRALVLDAEHPQSAFNLANTRALNYQYREAAQYYSDFLAKHNPSMLMEQQLRVSDPLRDDDDKQDASRPSTVRPPTRSLPILLQGPAAKGMFDSRPATRENVGAKKAEEVSVNRFPGEAPSASGAKLEERKEEAAAAGRSGGGGEEGDEEQVAAEDEEEEDEEEQQIFGVRNLRAERLRVALKLTPLALNNRAICFQMLGELDKAIEGFTLAMKHNPSDVNILLNRALVYLRRGDANEAMADLSKVMQERRDAFLERLMEFCQKREQGMGAGCHSLEGGLRVLPAFKTLSFDLPQNSPHLFDPLALSTHGSPEFLRLERLLGALAADVEANRSSPKFLRSVEAALYYLFFKEYNKAFGALAVASYLMPVKGSFAPDSVNSIELTEVLALWRVSMLLQSGQQKAAVMDLSLSISTLCALHVKHKAGPDKSGSPSVAGSHADGDDAGSLQSPAHAAAAAPKASAAPAPGSGPGQVSASEAQEVKDAGEDEIIDPAGFIMMTMARSKKVSSRPAGDKAEIPDEDWTEIPSALSAAAARRVQRDTRLYNYLGTL
jgi:tetratricopeptide (TPR) repeat protein